jgi:2-C-methyl-D-erythritol 4-phosphate cytidylyltransferase / 2-C-methyl-D-erythritol 2,4-cyclodiphosphate synthase
MGVTDTPGAWCVVVAGGAGQRFGGDAPKQFLSLGGRPVYAWAVEAALTVCDRVVLVCPVDRVEPQRERLAADGLDPARITVVPGGTTRAGSVANGLRAVPSDVSVVAVHDAARPLASAELFRRAIDALDTTAADGVVPGIAVVDTVKQIDDDGIVCGTPDRARLRAVQTPQVFRAARLRAAHESVPDGTDDAVMVESIGGRVIVIEGEDTNHKVTVPDDLAWAQRVLAGSSSDAAPSGLSVGEVAMTIPALRIGQGFDVHRTSDDPNRVLVLGGVTFPGEPGLVGHSDADAVAHAVTDALLGAAGLGDIGQQFPDTDPRFAGADSIALLRTAVALVRDAGWQPINVDCSVICERPKLAPARDEMQRILTDAVGAPVTVKGRRPEQLGALGRREGIVCMATALCGAIGG